jgi:murein L,D-transpeptidase YcbB/YkuD
MRKTFLSLIWVVVAAMPMLNAQQASPSQTTSTQQTSKLKATGTRAFPQPRVQPTQAATAKDNRGHGKRIVNDPGHQKGVASNSGNGKTTDNNIGRGKTTTTNNDNDRAKYQEAMRRYRHERHDHDWWKQHYIVIVLVGGGYYYCDSGYWCPAWGYDPNYERYEYDGPIYTYGNLLPDQVIVNVQHALKELGYYAGDVNGSLGVNTRRALTAYQQDSGLDATGVVDEATVRALGLI